MSAKYCYENYLISAKSKAVRRLNLSIVSTEKGVDSKDMTQEFLFAPLARIFCVRVSLKFSIAKKNGDERNV